ncbi:cation diffusion facilitator family transporter [Spartinivicinus poritis]|uniref:Cation diffusion facilitator family transporter n=1 Tax=Spartinivicinus poritis TaxID=2994640 RepID=A0ABT5U4N0_9GAMM|nr:cation diffusion facilitator family transporter [Spartinivicinus sp. A2-2]MDE1461321.1 cation diffusion facilitator family transporter [Spartinivicinus sp. A2-2]
MASGSKKVIVAALIGNSLVAITKFIASFITGSSAMFSEAIHSVVDSGNQVLLLYGLKQSKKPASEEYPFGHGKEVYFWSFVVAILIFAVGAGISIYEGIHHILHPTPITNPIINYIVLTLAIIFEGGCWWVAMKEFKKVKGEMGYLEAVHKGKDPSLFVVFFEDSAAILGLLIALLSVILGQVTGNPYFDGIASVLIGIILATTAIWLAYETKSLLIGESARGHIVRGIRHLARGESGVAYINEVVTMQMGPEFILANLSIDFDDDLQATDIERIIVRIDQTIKLTYPNVKRVFIEAKSRVDAIASQAQPVNLGE